jgi:hypothetical protein
MNAPFWEQDQLNKCRQKYAYYDEELRDYGARPPEPIMGQSKRGYQRKALGTMQRIGIPQIDKLSVIDLNKLDGATIDALEPQILQACKNFAEDPSTVLPGEFRQVKVHNPYTGRVDAIKFIGPESFVKQFARPGRPVKSFWAPKDSQGRELQPLNMSGRPKHGWAA